MIDLRKRAYLYLHRRLDTNEVFYVGIGIVDNFQRAFSKSGRNNWWKKIVNKYGFSVEIIKEELAWYRACTFEKKLIKFYGRQNLNSGSLVNMTDGGEGTFGLVLSDITRLKMGNSRRGKKHTDETKNKISKIHLGIKKSKEHIEKIREAKVNKGRLVLDLETGIYYFSAKDAAFAKNFDTNNLTKKLRGVRKNKTNLVYC